MHFNKHTRARENPGAKAPGFRPPQSLARGRCGHKLLESEMPNPRRLEALDRAVDHINDCLSFSLMASTEDVGRQTQTKVCKSLKHVETTPF